MSKEPKKLFPEQFQKSQWVEPNAKQPEADVLAEQPKPIPIAEATVPKPVIVGEKTVTHLDFGEFKENQWGKPTGTGFIIG